VNTSPPGVSTLTVNEEPTRCEQCKAYQGHAPECTLNTYEQLRVHLDGQLKINREWQVRMNRAMDHSEKVLRRHRQASVDYHAKYMVVKHENNQLRRKLYPGKS